MCWYTHPGRQPSGRPDALSCHWHSGWPRGSGADSPSKHSRADDCIHYHNTLVLFTFYHLKKKSNGNLGNEKGDDDDDTNAAQGPHIHCSADLAPQKLV